ncbi:MAG: DUF732 domain-containing protein [Mycobacterium sp.]|nr:DUF732 domain-containing protein [Mycobacterium sp.]
MKKFLAPAVGAIFVYGMAFASPAYADEGSYYDALTTGGIVADDAALKLGYAICNEIAAGVPEGTTVVEIYQNTGNDITAAHAQVLYDAAAAFLCE